MIVGVLKEIKDQECRVSCTPAGTSLLVSEGHTVYVEKNAGIGSGISNEEYEKTGAIILDSAKEVWEKSEMIYKVKEPIESEYKYLRKGLIIFAYLHLAANPILTKELVDKEVIGVAFETVQIGKTLPLLQPMSEVAGRVSVQEGAKLLTMPQGGKGILLQGVPGVAPGHVVVIGAGISGIAAARMALGMGARVTVIDIDIEKLSHVLDIFSNKVETLYSNPYNISNAVKTADLVVSSALIPGGKAPKLVTKEMVKSMEKGSVIVDISIDQGGSTDYTSNRPTTHTDPTFIEEGVIHYSVANIPGAIPKTSTYALSNVTTKYALIIANLGWKEACKKFEELKLGINTANGKVINQFIAKDLNYEHFDISELL